MRAVIAEDMVLLREGIARVLAAADVDVVAQVSDARALVAAVSEHRPDIAVVDVRMPPTFVDEGARAALLIRERFPRTAVLVLSNVVDPRLASRLAAHRPDAFGYLLKDRVLDVDQFLADLTRVAEGGTVVDPLVVSDLMARSAWRLGDLTPRERDVLERIAGGLSNAAIADALVVSERTVDAHVRSIFVKLGLAPDGDRNRRVQVTLAWLEHGPQRVGAGTDDAPPPPA